MMSKCSVYNVDSEFFAINTLTTLRSKVIAVETLVLVVLLDFCVRVCVSCGFVGVFCWFVVGFSGFAGVFCGFWL